MCDGDDTRGSGDGVGGVVAAIERLRSFRRSGRSPAEMGRQLIALRHACDLLELEFSREAALFAATDEYDRAGSVSPIDWIRHECRMSGRAAADAVCVGEQAERLPLSTEAMTAGTLGFPHLALPAGCARAIQESVTGAEFQEAPLLAKALQHSVSRFRHDCAHARHAADADAFLKEQVSDVQARYLELLSCEGGALVVRGFLDAVGGATLRTALEPLARRSGADDERRRNRRLADALVELAGHRLDAGSLPATAGRATHLQVTASLETLRGAPGAPAGELEFVGPVAAATVQRLACDASITRVLLGPDSAVVDVGRSRRVPAGSTRTALAVRDGGCAWPGCERPASWTAAHHLHHWAQGGATDLANLILLCRRHHWLVHEGGWQLVRESDGTLGRIPPIPDYIPRARPPDQSVAA